MQCWRGCAAPVSTVRGCWRQKRGFEVWGGAGTNEGASGLVRCESNQGPRFTALADYPAVVQEPAARPSVFSDALKGMLCERMACPKGGQHAVLPPWKGPKRGQHQRAGNNTTHFIMQT